MRSTLVKNGSATRRQALSNTSLSICGSNKCVGSNCAGQEFAADAAGVFQSRIFPGAGGLHGPALLARDFPTLMAALNQGLATFGHATFVQYLAAQHKP